MKNNGISIHKSDGNSDMDECTIGAKIFENVYWFLSTFKSQNTRDSYKSDLQEFFIFCFFNLNIKVEEFEQITERLVLLWKNELSHFSSATIKRKLSTLSSFLAFLVKRKLIVSNIVKLILKPPISKDGKTNAFTHEEVIDILNNIHSHYLKLSNKTSRSYKVWRLRYAVLYTLFTVGMRVEELCNLKINDLEFNGEFWRLNMITKGNMNHSPVIHSETARILIEYKNEFRSEALPEDSFFVRTQLSKNLTKLSRSSIFDMVKICSQDAGLTKEVSPHSCRATLATLLHQNGIPIVEIQNLLNHKLVTTTAIYIKKSNEQLKSAMQKIDFFE